MSPASITVLRRSLVFSITALLVLAPMTSQAQIGGLIKKKVADAAAGRAQEKAGLTQPDAKLGTEFTAATLDKVINALELRATSVATSDSIARLIEPLEKQLADVQARSGDALSAYGAKHGQWNMCRNDAESEYRKSHADQQEAAAKAMAAKIQSDPAYGRRLSADLIEMQKTAAVAMNRGDTTAAKQMMVDWYKKWGLEAPDFVPESALAKCGKDAVVPADVAVRDTLEARISVLRTRQREVAEAGQESARAASGLSEKEFYPATERLERWFAIAVRGKKGARFWTDDEGKLFEARRARIERAFTLLRV